MDQLFIRPATLEDIPQLLLFEQAIIETERPMDVTIKEEKTSYYNLNQLINASNSMLLVGELGGKLIASGYARMEDAKDYNKHGHYAYLGFMYVVKEHRGKGMNQLIIEELMHWCRIQKIYEVRLDVYATNLAAIKAYQKIGFEPNLINMRMELKK